RGGIPHVNTAPGTVRYELLAVRRESDRSRVATGPEAHGAKAGDSAGRQPGAVQVKAILDGCGFFGLVGVLYCARLLCGRGDLVRDRAATGSEPQDQEEHHRDLQIA